MSWVMEAGEGSAIATLDASHAPAAKESDDAPTLEQAIGLHGEGKLARALAAYRTVMGLDRENAAAMILAASIHVEQGEHEAATWLLRRSLEVAPTCAAYNTLGHLVMNRREWDASIAAYRASLALDPDNTTTWPNILFALDLHPGATPGLRLAERRRFNARHCKELTASAPPHTNAPDPDRVLRVGYVSADFKQHSAAHGFGPVVKGHHRDRFEVHLYDVDQSPPNPDDQVSAEFRTLPETVWHDVRGHDDAALAALIRADGIDILVDLSGYSAGSRVMAFARKPAPIQISGFGYATGLGIDAMDYIIGDDVLIPEIHEHQYHERVMRLPVFMGYEPAPPWPELADPPKRRNGYTTYGYLGRSIKISPQTLAAWGEILQRDTSARLLLKCGEYKDEVLVRQIRDALVALGADAGRIEFRGGTSRYEHLQTYNDVDIMLDPFPHNGGVTTVESVLMGVPPITLIGNYVCGRVGASLLTTLGFKDAVARSPFEYVNNALSSGRETWTIEDRRAFRRRAFGSIMMDADGYATAAESAYRDAWRRWCAEQVIA